MKFQRKHVKVQRTAVAHFGAQVALYVKYGNTSLEVQTMEQRVVIVQRIQNKDVAEMSIVK